MARRNSTSSSSTSIPCPTCGAEVDLSEAFIQQLAAPLIDRAARDQAEQAAEEARAEAADQVAALKAQIKEQQSRTRENETQLRAELAAKDGQLNKAHTEERKLREAQRKLQQERDVWEIERERDRDSFAREERKRAQQHAKEQVQAERQRIEQQFNARVRDLEDQKKALTKEIQTLSRKTTAGPNPQGEGVARQHVFAEELRSRWPGDEVSVIPRGQRGADIIQIVRNKGRDCGIILWECKDTQRFQRAWLDKLADDIKQQRASIGVLVSTALPDNIEGSGWLGDILVCEFTLAAHLADPFRRLLIKTSQYTLANAARQGTAEKVYDYITTGGFIPCLELIVKLAKIASHENNQLREHVIQHTARFDKAIDDMIGSLLTMTGELAAVGTELPPSLRAELPAARKALPAVPAKRTRKAGR
ncbi:Uncharacterized protein conserved in bacteria [Mycobacteroides abscessus subsp. massiliense]|uniref:DUF2130 domain-containing protein n=1 Tax=Mycobacteroides abscessus TaxID=36809 RepID=UPI0002D39333|nr:DUF2130 domain-containing protein [Mycobacteroides abscessus]MDB2215842.1 DUF2130 domain-containing protein [Mycobacteroides abscessus subsp. massiliense]SIE58696.1 Uncharacterized protein conserved in bacteria [Mycobacteroides abscessus subsp. abscessus]SKM80270.1 Uncharacterized protein conserved in bacteria [Mycobacteroides abscessus subsp. massiliense]SKM99687.1 Uncharacterized protein conserved in bacteria [Mycobacteroides abscessus subsp. massiliense]SKV27497.1 Uncharacterized protein